MSGPIRWCWYPLRRRRPGSTRWPRHPASLPPRPGALGSEHSDSRRVTGPPRWPVCHCCSGDGHDLDASGLRSRPGTGTGAPRNSTRLTGHRHLVRPGSGPRVRRGPAACPGRARRPHRICTNRRAADGPPGRASPGQVLSPGSSPYCSSISTVSRRSTTTSATPPEIDFIRVLAERLALAARSQHDRPSRRRRIRGGTRRPPPMASRPWNSPTGCSRCSRRRS